MTDYTCSRAQILEMEKAILDRLQWNLTVPTPYVFLLRFVKAASSSDLRHDKEVKINTTTHVKSDTTDILVCLLEF
jgi:cyclin B